MTPLLIAVIAVVAVVLTIHSARRALAERDAVERHHRTLDVLGTLADRADAVVPSAPRAPAYQPRHRKSGRTRRPISPPLLVSVVGAVLVAIAVGGYLAGRRRGGTSPSQPLSQPGTTTTTRLAPGVAPTSPANVAPVVLVSNNDQQATYRVQRSSAVVELVPTAPCWVEIKAGLGQGPVVFSGTLRPGSRRTLPSAPATGGVTVRLGNPAAMSVSVDGTTVAVPRPTGTKPFTLVFEPAS